MTDLVLFGVFPYVAVAVGALGLVVRAAGARRSFSSRSSQFLEGRVLFWGSVPWHYAVLPVLGAHAAAAIFPGAWATLLGEPSRLVALEVSGAALGLWAVAAGVILAVRRARTPRLAIVTSPVDWVVLGLLLVQVGTGVAVALTLRWGSVWYLHTAVPWLRSLARLEPRIEYAAILPGIVKLHALSAFALVAVAPFTRLAHVAVAPIAYLWRPYQLVTWKRRRGA